MALTCCLYYTSRLLSIMLKARFSLFIKPKGVLVIHLTNGVSNHLLVSNTDKALNHTESHFFPPIKLQGAMEHLL